MYILNITECMSQTLYKCYINYSKNRIGSNRYAIDEWYIDVYNWTNSIRNQPAWNNLIANGTSELLT